MRGKWLRQKGKGKVILFCNGWGMDEQPFRGLDSQAYDVYMLFDYRQLDLPAEVDQLWERYDEVTLVAWSMGVWVGQRVLGDRVGGFSQAVAINGTLCPIDDLLGIPRSLFANTLAAFDGNTRLRFYRRMCRQKNLFHAFLEHQPQRTVIEQKEELQALLRVADCQSGRPSLYDVALIADDDHIVPTVNQLRFWAGQSFSKLAGPHFLFPLWRDWDQLVAAAL